MITFWRKKGSVD